MTGDVTGLDYEVVDVFTDHRYGGNALAVVLDDVGLDATQMQRIAVEFNLSETAFCRPPARGGSYALRIFTPATELPFAGHPSVGSAWVLHRRGRIGAGAGVQECGAGDLAIEVDGEGARLTGGAPSWAGEVDPGPLLAAVGLGPDDLSGTAGRAGCGIDFTYLPVRPEAIARCEPDLSALRRMDLATGLSVSSWDGTTAATRVFVPDVGIAEDPATGAAALGFGVLLAATGQVPDGVSSYVVQQGVDMGRPSRLDCTVTVARGAAVATSVRGLVHPVMQGRLLPPP